MLNRCLKNARGVLTEYFPSTSIFCHQINHPLCLHDLVQRQESESDTNERLAAQREGPTTLSFVVWSANNHFCLKETSNLQSWEGTDIKTINKHSSWILHPGIRQMPYRLRSKQRRRRWRRKKKEEGPLVTCLLSWLHLDPSLGSLQCLKFYLGSQPHSGNWIEAWRFWSLCEAKGGRAERSQYLWWWGENCEVL